MKGNENGNIDASVTKSGVYAWLLFKNFNLLFIFSNFLDREQRTENFGVGILFMEELKAREIVQEVNNGKTVLSTLVFSFLPTLCIYLETTFPENSHGENMK